MIKKKNFKVILKIFKKIDFFIFMIILIIYLFYILIYFGKINSN